MIAFLPGTNTAKIKVATKSNLGNFSVKTEMATAANSKTNGKRHEKEILYIIVTINPDLSSFSRWYKLAKNTYS